MKIWLLEEQFLHEDRKIVSAHSSYVGACKAQKNMELTWGSAHTTVVSYQILEMELSEDTE